MFLKSEDNRISIIVGLILATLIMASGFSVYGLMQQKAKSILSKTLEVSLLNNIHLFEDQIAVWVNNTQTVSTRFTVIEGLQQPRTSNGKVKEHINLQQIAQSFLPTGFIGVAFYNAQDREVAQAGRFSQTPVLRVPLNTKNPAFLLWDGQFILQVSMEVVDRQGHRIGRVMTEKSLPQLTQAITAVADMTDKSGELAVCAPSEQGMQCFPTTLHSKDILKLPLVIDGQALPMKYALEGKTGVISALDYRRENVVAAYAPIGTLGLAWC